MSKRPSPIWLRTPVLVVSVLLIVQIALFYTISTSEYIPNPPPLKNFSTSVGSWQSVRETELETEVQALLKADDTLSRDYAGPNGMLNLFVAFFRSQRAGVTPHSPKVCLPANGWVSESSTSIDLTVPGEAKPIPVNVYTVRHGEEQSTVVYWYQGAHRAVADEYAAKLYLMLDSLRYRRSDQALIRVVVPIVDSPEKAQQSAMEFVRAIYPSLKRQIWPDTAPAPLNAQAAF